MRSTLLIVASFLISTSVVLADTAQERLNTAANVFQQIMATPDQGIPHDLLARAQCVVIIPGMKKAGFVVGGEYGRGFAECRQSNGTGWGAPAAVRMEGGSVGFQIGGSSTDIVMLVMNRQGMDRLLKDKVTLGADASIAAGPVGRTANAETDAELHAEMLAWSRSRGAFAGISLNGATLRPDRAVNAELYGKKMSNREILTSNMTPPPAAQQLVSELDRYSARKGSGTAARSTDNR
ncbi:MAG TPA: lipid-binding SYLF domain-containing protein [Bryobacteraceae bacterium]|nr:lipid-binding SYLF domain-containing protein [Bryobacteraceae bacterium]